jgi:SAM-dependent methyltransferase
LNQPGLSVDEHTRTAFSLEWALHRPEDGTWGMTIEERTRWYFLSGVGLSQEEAKGLTVLDAGCGNGSSTLGMARLGAFAVGLDQSSGLDKSVEYLTPADQGLALSYVQGNLMDAPFAPASFDVVFSAGVLHHTPDTRQAFLALAPLVKPGGRYYVWLYRREPCVTAIVDTIRFFTTRLPHARFGQIAWTMAPAFRLFTQAANALGVRSYRPMSRESAALALHDIFGAPHAHAHTYEEVCAWYEEAGFDRPRLVGLERRGFGVCGRRPG